jgi:hypothetical protein
VTLFSALEDLQRTTLRVIRGSLRRLEYLAQLKDIKGEYLHWGLARVHGKDRASAAIAESHRGQVSRVLSTPLRDLLRDVGSSSQEAGLSKEEYLALLVSRFPHLLPPDSGAATNRHLNSVLQALSSLNCAQNRASVGQSAAVDDADASGLSKTDESENGTKK